MNVQDTLYLYIYSIFVHLIKSKLFFFHLSTFDIIINIDRYTLKG